MIKCHLSTRLGERKLRVADVAKETGLNRSTITKLYHETAVRIDIDVVNKLCQFLKCSVGDLFEYIEDE